MKYKVTNITNDARKFRDTFLGKDVVLGAGKSTFSNKPPTDNRIWKVEEEKEVTKVVHTEKLEKKPSTEKEDKQ